jgi:hypothetical protein
MLAHDSAVTFVAFELARIVQVLESCCAAPAGLDKDFFTRIS